MMMKYLKMKRDQLFWIRRRIIAIDAKCVTFYESLQKAVESVSKFMSLWSSKKEDNKPPLDFEQTQESSLRKAIEAIRAIGNRLLR